MCQQRRSSGFERTKIARLIACVIEEGLQIHDVWMGDETHDLKLAILADMKKNESVRKTV